MGARPARPYNGNVRYGVIADDLTGACDVAGRLTHLGYRPIIYVSPVTPKKSLAFLPDEAAVVIVNTRSRDGSLREAVARARAAARFLERHGAPVTYQKIDSTLRGHWAEEMRSIAQVIQPQHVLLCPAFPAQGRLVRNGHLRVRPGPCPDISDFSATNEEPSIGVRITKRCRWDALEVHRGVIRRGPEAIRAAVHTGAGADCVVFDAERDADLQATCRALRRSAGRLLWVGSAGLVRYAIPPPSRPESALPSRRRFPWLFVQGSRQAISAQQFRLLRQSRGICTIEFSPSRSRKNREEWCASVVAALAVGTDVAVTAPEKFDARVPIALRCFLDLLLRAVVRGAKLGGIFISGGQTAEAVCDSLRVATLRVVEEVSPGIAVSIALDGRCPGLCLVTKAGGFGRSHEVCKILEEYVRVRSRRSTQAYNRHHPG